MRDTIERWVIQCLDNLAKRGIISCWTPIVNEPAKVSYEPFVVWQIPKSLEYSNRRADVFKDLCSNKITEREAEKRLNKIRADELGLKVITGGNQS